MSQIEFVPSNSTTMVHYQCGECEMSATGVLNAPMEEAWGDHMDTHPPQSDCSKWIWEALRLF